MERAGRNGGTLRSFEKGQSGNPAGRPSGRGMISQIMKELGDYSDLELSLTMTSRDGKVICQQLSYSVDGQHTVFALIAIQIIWKAIRGDINAFKVLLDRTEGRVPPPIKLEPYPAKPLVNEYAQKTPRQLRQELDQVGRQMAAASTPVTSVQAAVVTVMKQ